MGASSSKGEPLPQWAPPELSRRAQKSVSRYAALRHPNGSITHLVGVEPGSAASALAAKEAVRSAAPESMLLELCDERVLPLWELLERGGCAKDGRAHQDLQPLSYATMMNDARLRSFTWWLLKGPESEAVAGVLGMSLSSALAQCAAESAKLGAQTHTIDRRCSVTAQRALIAALEDSPLKPGWPPAFKSTLEKLSAAIASAAASEDLTAARAETLATLHETSSLALLDEHQADQNIRRIFIDERDSILAHRCWEALNGLGPGGVSVAIVDAVHVDGIQANWSKTKAEDIQALLEPRDFKSVVAAAGPITGLTLAASAASIKLALRGGPRTAVVTALALAPVLGAAYGAKVLVERYETARLLQRKFRALG